MFQLLAPLITGAASAFIGSRLNNNSSGQDKPPVPGGSKNNELGSGYGGIAGSVGSFLGEQARDWWDERNADDAAITLAK